MNDIVGYVYIKQSTTGISPATIKEFLNVPLRVMEFSETGVLVIHPNGEAIATFDNVDIVCRFECSYLGNVVCPPNMSLGEKIAYAYRCQNRKGGYNDLLCRMVIMSSRIKDDSTMLFFGNYNKIKNQK